MLFRAFISSDEIFFIMEFMRKLVRSSSSLVRKNVCFGLSYVIHYISCFSYINDDFLGS